MSDFDMCFIEGCNRDGTDVCTECNNDVCEDHIRVTPLSDEFLCTDCWPVKYAPMTLQQVAERVDPAAAQIAIARILAGLGSQAEWSSEDLEWIATTAMSAKPAGLPSASDQDDDALAFWQEVDR